MQPVAPQVRALSGKTKVEDTKGSPNKDGMVRTDSDKAVPTGGDTDADMGPRPRVTKDKAYPISQLM